MLYKRIICPTCGGLGFISHFTENSVSSKSCPNCTDGTIVSPITNGDLIRRCSNEQLAKVHENLNKWAIYSGGENNRLLDNSSEDFLFWLNRVTDDTDLQTIFDFIDEKDYEQDLWTKVVEA